MNDLPQHLAEVRAHRARHWKKLDEGDCVPLKPAAHSSPSTGEDSAGEFHNPIGIAADPFHDSMRSLDEILTSKNIRGLLMLTPSIDKRATLFLRPYSRQFWLQRKPSFILNKRQSISLTYYRRLDFLLMSPEILPPFLLWSKKNGTSGDSGNTAISLSPSKLGERES